MNAEDQKLAKVIEDKLMSFHKKHGLLIGIQRKNYREVFVRQIIESIRRIKYVTVIRTRNISPRRTDPNDEFFDPLLAAILQQRLGNIEEAFWMVFLFVHFGKHPKAGWRYAKEIYGRLGAPLRWNWENVSQDVHGFRLWLDEHQAQLKRVSSPQGFGNHRKYESLDAISPHGTGAIVESYVKWVNPPRTHEILVDELLQKALKDPKKAFQLLYESMSSIVRFGRLAKFDYLTTLGKIGLANISPGSTYMQGATGPISGARLLFTGNPNTKIHHTQLDIWLEEVNNHMDLGMQVLEDALCNWQKSPNIFYSFRG